MLVDVIRQIPQIEQILPNLIYFCIPFFGITLQQAANTKAKILANNLKSADLQDLRVQIQDALANERIALEGRIEFTQAIAQRASLAKMVQTKIDSSTRKRDSAKLGKHKIRKYMQGR